jgi:hypothetical protein
MDYFLVLRLATFLSGSRCFASVKIAVVYGGISGTFPKLKIGFVIIDFCV